MLFFKASIIDFLTACHKRLYFANVIGFMHKNFMKICLGILSMKKIFFFTVRDISPVFHKNRGKYHNLYIKRQLPIVALARKIVISDKTK